MDGSREPGAAGLVVKSQAHQGHRPDNAQAVSQAPADVDGKNQLREPLPSAVTDERRPLPALEKISGLARALNLPPAAAGTAVRRTALFWPILQIFMQDSLICPGWSSRGYLPHFDGQNTTHMVTFRLMDAVPRKWMQTYREVRHASPQRRKFENSLNAGLGMCWLRRKELAREVENVLLHGHAVHYDLHAWVVMPTHVHVLLTPRVGEKLSAILRSWKIYSARRINLILGRHGPFWYPDYYDRFIRDQRHFRAALRYVEFNPVSAGLCSLPELWPCGSARYHVRKD